MNRQSAASLVIATPRAPGAIAILQIIGDECQEILQSITGMHDWPIGRVRLVDLARIDAGLAVKLSPRVAQVMPHGGPRVVQRLTAELLRLGVRFGEGEVVHDPRDLFPEAEDRIEALMLLAMSRAESPLAVELLLDQPRRWRAVTGRHGGLLHPELGSRGGLPQLLDDEDRARSRRLNRLIQPPIVVLAGRPNVGKSTLSNALLGRAMSIAADVPGTTRDYTASRLNLSGLVVDWHDTPGIRASGDAIERKAIEIARRLIQQADLLIAMRDVLHDWPDLPREPDLRVMNKMDVSGESGRDEASDVLGVSALRGDGVAQLVRAVRDRLVRPADLAHAGRWIFDERLLD